MAFNLWWRWFLAVILKCECVRVSWRQEQWSILWIFIEFIRVRMMARMIHNDRKKRRILLFRTPIFKMRKIKNNWLQMMICIVRKSEFQSLKPFIRNSKTSVRQKMASPQMRLRKTLSLTAHGPPILLRPFAPLFHFCHFWSDYLFYSSSTLWKW